ncbi:MAG: hypothetical protein DRN15_09510 [Thermoprotei archaeon]|nr:MAG: hypothetical protein DRN15_09510 [Thermoprotei archaeon]
MESHKRTLVKTLCWRISGILLSILLTWIMTGSLMLGAQLGIAYNIIRAIQYYITERAWNRIQWGRVKEYHLG